MNSFSLPTKHYGMANGLRSVMEIPIGFRHVFNFEYFNHTQSRIFDDVYYSDNSMVLSAPTGSGKTVLFELAIVRLLLKLHDIQQNDYKIVYIAPMKALCNEKLLEWRRVFGRFGIVCESMTSDTGDIDLKNMMSFHLLLTTPEKWDFISRRWRDCTTFFENVKLFMIDEVHLLNEERRGAILETIVMRMKTLQKLKTDISQTETIRFIAASATIPNVEDLAIWLGQENVAKYIRVSEDHRPVKLDRHVFGFTSDSHVNGFRFDISLNYKLPGIIQKYSIGKPILIFCSTRKSVEMASNYLYSNLKLNLNVEQKRVLQLTVKQLHDTKLQGLLLKGIVYHHAGLDHSDRQLIENAFRGGNIPVLLCTNTLSMGVNLPAYMVIVKSTETYSKGTMKELEESTILQMIGRAGRPQFDTSGVAIIMTQYSKVKKYENLVSGTSPIESQLYQHLAVYLNSEIAIHTIVEHNVALEWLKSSFLFVRANKNPKHYGFLGTSSSEITNKLEAMCNAAINSLEHYKLIRKDGQTLVSTPCGRIMTRYYLSFQTMKILYTINGTENLQEIFNILSSFYEFSEHHLRVNEKRTLNELNHNKHKDTIRFKIKGKIQTVSHKTSCLMQAVFGNLNIPDPSLAQESMVLIKLADRLSRCLLDYITASEFSNGSFQATVSAVQLAKCCKSHLWENSIYVSKQLKKIGLTYSLQLATNGLTTFNSLLLSNPRHIENILKKGPPFGNEIIDGVSMLPKYKVSFQMESKKCGSVMVEQINKKYKYENKSNEGVVLIVGDDCNRVLLYNDTVQFILSEYETFNRSFKYRNLNISKIYIYLIHQSIVGVDEQLEYEIDQEHNIAKLIPIENSVKNNSKQKSNEPKKKMSMQVTLTQIVSNQDKSHSATSSTSKNEACTRIIEIFDTSDLSIAECNNEIDDITMADPSSLPILDWNNQCADVEISDTSSLSILELNNENAVIVISDDSDLSILECTDQQATVIEISDDSNLNNDDIINMEICDMSNISSENKNNNIEISDETDQALNNEEMNKEMYNISSDLSVTINTILDKSNSTNSVINDDNITSIYENLNDVYNGVPFKINNVKKHRKFVPIIKKKREAPCCSSPNRETVIKVIDDHNFEVSTISTEINIPKLIQNESILNETNERYATKKKYNFDIGINDYLEVPKETYQFKLQSTNVNTTNPPVTNKPTNSLLHALDFIRGYSVDDEISTYSMDNVEDYSDIYNLSVSKNVFLKFKSATTTLNTNNLFDSNNKSFDSSNSIVTADINNSNKNIGTQIELPIVQTNILCQNLTTNTVRSNISAPHNFICNQISNNKRFKFDTKISDKTQKQNINFAHQLNLVLPPRQPIQLMNSLPPTSRSNSSSAVYQSTFSYCNTSYSSANVTDMENENIVSEESE